MNPLLLLVLLITVTLTAAAAVPAGHQVVLIDRCGSETHADRVRQAAISLVQQADELGAVDGRRVDRVLTFSSDSAYHDAVRYADSAAEEVDGVRLATLFVDAEQVRRADQGRWASELKISTPSKGKCGSALLTLAAIRQAIDVAQGVAGDGEDVQLVVIVGSEKYEQPWDRAGEHEDDETLQYFRTTSVPVFADQAKQTKREPAAVKVIEDAAVAVLESKVRVAVFVDHMVPGVVEYVGDPRLADMYADYSHFNPGVTLVRLDRNGHSHTFQGLLLGHGLDVRVFSHNALTKPSCLRHLFSDVDPTFHEALEDLCATQEQRDACDSDTQFCAPSHGCVDVGAARAAVGDDGDTAASAGDDGMIGVAAVHGDDDGDDDDDAQVEFHDSLAPHHRVIGAQSLEEEAGGTFDADGNLVRDEQQQQQQQGASSTGEELPPLIRKGKYENATSTSGSRWSLDHAIKHRVKVIEWSPDKEFAEHLKLRQLPVILRNSVVCKWRVLRDVCRGESQHSLWTPAYLKEKMGITQLPHVKSSTQRFFTNLDPKSSMKGKDFPLMNWTVSYDIRNMTTEEFFDKVNKDSNHDDNSNSRMMYYYFGDMLETLKDDAHPSTMLYVTDNDLQRAHQFLWISSPGVNMYTHMDMDHNYFVQIDGRKRFTLVPPFQRERMYNFPRIHPLWHKSQVDFDQPDLDAFPEYRRVEAWVADLQPGDVLYVPPIWWHQVESLDYSVSLSTWSHGQQAYEAMWAVYGFHPKFESIHNRTGRVYAMRMFLDLLVRKMYGATATLPFFQRLLHTRYEHVKEHFVPSRGDVAFCGDRIPTQLHVVQDCEFDVEIVSAHFFKVNPEMRDMLFMDFVEQITATAIGPRRVYSFLRYCFRGEGQDYKVIPKEQGDMFV